MKYKTLIFDLDRTLLRASDEYIFYWHKKCFKEVTGRDFTDEEIEDYLKKPIHERQNYILEVVGFDSVQQFLDMWITDEAIEQRMQSLVLYCDIRALLELKKRGVKLGLVTRSPEKLGSKEIEYLEEILRCENLLNHAVYIIGSDLPMKPDPAALIFCMEQLSADKPTTAYIGDLEMDIIMANNVGIDAFLIDRGENTTDVLPSKMDTSHKRITSLNELLQYI